MLDMFSIVAKELGVKAKQVEAAVDLLDQGNTVPFIARYRKEVTGELQDEQLRTIEERIQYLRNLEKTAGGSHRLHHRARKDDGWPPGSLG